MNEEEREKILKQMKQLSAGFYGGAIHIGCHPFIEFTGIMNEYIQACERAHLNGIDFTMCNVHTGQVLPLKPFEKNYINEKLECIFVGQILIK
jgi:hypothetical protein